MARILLQYALRTSARYWVQLLQGAPLVQLSEYGFIVYREIEEIHLHYEGVVVDKFVVMPNHIHMIVRINRNDGAPRASSPTTALVPTVIAAFKKKINKIVGFSIWQASYHDHIIRGKRDYHEIWDYIDTNPLRWNLDEYYEQEKFLYIFGKVWYNI